MQTAVRSLVQGYPLAAAIVLVIAVSLPVFLSLSLLNRRRSVCRRPQPRRPSRQRCKRSGRPPGRRMTAFPQTRRRQRANRPPVQRQCRQRPLQLSRLNPSRLPLRQRLPLQRRRHQPTCMCRSVSFPRTSKLALPTMSRRTSSCSPPNPGWAVYAGRRIGASGPRGPRHFGRHYRQRYMGPVESDGSTDRPGRKGRLDGRRTDRNRWRSDDPSQLHG